MKIKWDLKNIPSRMVWNRVKSLRENMKLSQIQVATGAGISVTTIWMIEQGFDEKTTEMTKQKIADFFKCDILDIFPSEMIGSKPREYPEEKKTVKMQFFVSEGKK